MNYKEILFPYQPLETGDFMYRYYINHREYIIYSPEKNKVSCLSLCNFKDITPFELLVSIQRPKILKEELEEFCFSQVCSKEDLLRYLFDIVGTGTQYRKIRGVSNSEAYLLYDIRQPEKIRNLFHFNPNNSEYQLVFDDEICMATIYNEIRSNAINVCWNPVIFKRLEEWDENKSTSFLIPSSSPILCAEIFKKAMERSASINMYCGENSLEGLLFFSSFIEKKELEKTISIYIDDKTITIYMKKWFPTTLVTFVARIQKMYNSNIRKFYEENLEGDITVYQLLSVAGSSFIVIPHDEFAINIFLKEIIIEYKLNDIFYAEI